MRHRLSNSLDWLSLANSKQLWIATSEVVKNRCKPNEKEDNTLIIYNLSGLRTPGLKGNFEAEKEESRRHPPTHLPFWEETE